MLPLSSFYRFAFSSTIEFLKQLRLRLTHTMPQRRSWIDVCPTQTKIKLVNCTTGGYGVQLSDDPTRFIVTDNRRRHFFCAIGDPHRCSCSSSQPCQHVLYVLVNHFKISITNPSIWQQGVSDLQLSEWIAQRASHERCFFCRDEVEGGTRCTWCGTRAHDRCRQLAATAGKCNPTACPRCSRELPAAQSTNARKCRSCRRLCNDDYYRCLLCDDFCLCPHCYSNSGVHASHPFSHPSAANPAPPPAAAASSNLADLQYREINPEDYDALVQLEGREKKRALPPHLLASLPVEPFKSADSINQSCPICQQDYSAHDLCLILPCRHTMHRECGRQWLSAYSNECPLDHIKVEVRMPKNERAMASKSECKQNQATSETRSRAGVLTLPPIRPSRQL